MTRKISKELCNQIADMCFAPEFSWSSVTAVYVVRDLEELVVKATFNNDFADQLGLLQLERCLVTVIADLERIHETALLKDMERRKFFREELPSTFFTL